MKGKRTNLEFEDHELIVTQEGNTMVHYLKKPNTRIDSIKFINSNGIMAVTGDYGNWIFCREFHPTEKDNAVSDSYWEEKLRIASSQRPYEYDEEATIENIGRITREKNDEKELTEDEREYLKSLIEAAQEGDEHTYNRFAYENGVGRFSDYESIPTARTKTKYWLKVIFDAFEEVCRRMKETSATSTPA